MDNKTRSGSSNAPEWSSFALACVTNRSDNDDDITSIAEISEQAKRLASRSNYKNRTILNTGATDHICNNYNRFVSWDTPGRRTVIKTGAGNVKVCVTGTIKMAVLCADGSINTITFNGVLYAPNMFLSIISHSKVRAKGCYWHGWDEKIYRKSDKLELAYTPKIDGVPNILQVANEDDKLGAARALAFASQHGSHNSHTPPFRKVTLKELHETFGHADVKQLRKLVDTTTDLQLTDVSRFSCEVCMISNSRLQVLRVVPEHATHLFQRVHVDLVGPISPPGLNGERWWSLYTEDLVRYRTIDLSPTKEGFGRSLIGYVLTIKTQYGIQVALVHTDNDLVLINTNTTKKLASKGTRFEPSTPYAHHQNGVAESSNRIEAARVRAMVNAAPHLPQSLWTYAARYAVDLLNHYPTTAITDNKTPQQLLLEHTGATNPVPNLYSFRKFGELGWVHIPEERRVQSKTFAPCAQKMYFVGRKGFCIYLMWDLNARKVVRSSSVVFSSTANLVDAPIERAMALPESPQSIPLSLSTLLCPTPHRPQVEVVLDNDYDLPKQGLGHRFESLVVNNDSTILNNSTPPRQLEAPCHLDISATG
jgi:hypothetical protein